MSMTQLGSLQNMMAVNAVCPAPEVGMGCTIIGWTDRHAATIFKVGRTANGQPAVWVQEDNAVRTDSNGMSDAQAYRYERNPNGAKRCYTLRKDGKYHAMGDTLRSPALLVGARMHYYDYGF
jgi:hypothetical protein